MATFKVRPKDGDSFIFPGIDLTNNSLSEDLKTGIDACEQHGVLWAEADIGNVVEPVRGVGSGGRLIYRGQDKSWAAVKTWIFQVQQEEAEVRAPGNGISCLGALALCCLPLAGLVALLYLIGLGFVVETICQIVWYAIISLPHAIWVSLTPH